MALYEDSKGTLWLGLRNGLLRWKPGSPQFFSIPEDSFGVTSFLEMRKGSSYSAVPLEYGDSSMVALSHIRHQVRCITGGLHECSATMTAAFGSARPSMV